jgi:outer membrane immunogenic protein
MKAKLNGMLALSVVSAAALFLGVGAARADGMPAPAASYTPPTSWTGLYVGFASGWDWDDTHVAFPQFDTHANWSRDGFNAGLFGGYQRQFGAIVLGVEFSLIGNQFDDEDNKVTGIKGNGNCPNPEFNCVGRITDIFTVGGRLGYAVGNNWLPYVTGGWATGSNNFRAVCNIPGDCGAFAPGVAAEWADGRSYGYYIGGGLDWKLTQYAVVGIEYRHTDLGAVTEQDFNPLGVPVELVRMRAESDALLLRGSLLFNPTPTYAPLK